MSKPKKKRYSQMSTGELAAATREFDREIVEVPARPMPPQLKARHDRIMKRARGRPKVGQGARRVLITVEGGLLRAADEYARKLGITRSELIARGLRKAVMSRKPSGTPRQPS